MAADVLIQNLIKDFLQPSFVNNWGVKENINEKDSKGKMKEY